VILHEEQPVVEKRTVPRERVRLEKEAVTSEEQVADEVRKEQIDLDDQRGR
jgi:stress response protein YsnF